jgi:transglutaminase-like putative cysteine protease
MRLEIQQTLHLAAIPARQPQNLRLIPFLHKGVHIEHWQLAIDGRTDWPLFRDGFGNQVLSLNAREDQDSLAIALTGRLETFECYGMVQESVETLPPLFYANPTPLTLGDAALEALAFSAARRAGKPIEQLHALMLAVPPELKLNAWGASPMLEASAALALGEGSVCEAAHIFIACAKILGFPARFVSGFLWLSEESLCPIVHAWAEVHVVDLGWVGFDPSFGLCPTEFYLRTSIGRDGMEAAPIRSNLEVTTQEALAATKAYQLQLQSLQ